MIDYQEHFHPLLIESRLRKGWFLIWLVSSLAWIVVIPMLLTIPVDPKNRQLLGFSLGRFILVGIAGFLFLANLSLAWLARLRPAWRKKFLDPLVTNPILFHSFAILQATIAVGIWLGLFLYNNYTHPFLVVKRYASYYERLIPFLTGIFLESLVILIGLLILHHGLNFQALRKEKFLWLLTLGILGFGLLTWLFAWSTGIGLTPDKTGWGSPGVPLLFYQVLLAWIAGLIVLVLLLLPKQKLITWQGIGLDFLLCLALWASAVWAWSSLEVQRSYFAPSPAPPNFETYPYSDAGFYDYTAQSVLLGYGFLGGQIVPRPLYILLLAGFHAIAGQDYDQTIYVQTLLLALLPVFLYLLGKNIHSRALGFSLGILAILREFNSILSTPWVEVSHSKLFLSDLPTTVAIIALTWLTVHWLVNPKRNWTEAILVGGVLGIATLLRAQAIFLLPAIVLAAMACYWRQWKNLARTLFLIILGLTVVVLPWLLRNWDKAGRIVFDDPATQSALIAQRYSSEMGERPARRPGETEGAYSARLSGSVRQFILANPGFVASFVGAHSMNNLVATILVLPMRFSITQRCDTLNICTPFWDSLVENFTPRDAVLLFINMIVVALGIASSWRKWRVAGIIPGIYFIMYSLSNALARNSARRYILPVDWVSYLYLMIGLFEIAIWIAVFFGARQEKIDRGLTRLPESGAIPGRFQPWIRIGAFSAIFLLIGLSLPLAERYRHPMFPQENQAQILADLLSIQSVKETPLPNQALQEFATKGKVVLLKGRAFYPRYYEPLAGEPGSAWPAYKPYEYRPTGKMGFILIGPQGATQINLALNSVPAAFPNAADVIILGCQENNYVDALLVAFIDGSNQLLLRSKLDNLTCPLK
jgi:hypothetical protein